MKVTIKNQKPERNIVAVIGTEGVCLFVRAKDGGVMSLTGCGLRPESGTIEELAKHAGRTPVYKGDEVTITF